ncbi:MAG: class I SAM-dependent methyltransferase [Pelovirga sp.]
MEKSQQEWNERWQEKSVDADWQPDPWLQRIVPFLPRGSALDVACGMGRNAVYLAEQGFAVTAVDLSNVALDLLRREAQRRELEIDIRQVDLEGEAQLPAGSFDLVIQFFFLHRPLLMPLLDKVRPGGFAVLRTFSRAGSARFGAVPDAISFAPGELFDLFSGWDLLVHEEGLEPSKKGGTLAGVVARRKE